MSKAECTWREDAEGTWHTDCGGLFNLFDDTPTDNGMAFCCYCGGKLAEVLYTEPTMDDNDEDDEDFRIDENLREAEK